MVGSCSHCGKRFKDSDYVYDLVKGEYEPENGGMAAIGGIARFCESCATWIIDAIVRR